MEFILGFENKGGVYVLLSHQGQSDSEESERERERDMRENSCSSGQS